MGYRLNEERSIKIECYCDRLVVTTVTQYLSTPTTEATRYFQDDSMAVADSSKPIAFCEHLQLSSLGVQPASISFQVREYCVANVLRVLMQFTPSPLS